MNSSQVIQFWICLEREQRVKEMTSHPRFDLHLIKNGEDVTELNFSLMWWILPQFFSRNKNIVYPYLGKKGCDENDEAKGSGKVLDPDSVCA